MNATLTEEDLVRIAVLLPVVFVTKPLAAIGRHDDGCLTVSSGVTKMKGLEVDQ